MLMPRSTSALGNASSERRMSPLTRSPSSHKLLHQRRLYQLVLQLLQCIFQTTHAKLPPHCHYNHTINLQPIFTSHITKIYPLNPAELQTCKEFVEKHLKTGWIIPSKSPQASPFFFIPKKDRSLHPCQDYWYLNFHTV